MLVLIFPGQGSQRPGMGIPWRDHPSWQFVGQLSEVVGRDLGELLLDAGPDTLRATRNAQLATYTLSLVALDAATKGPVGDAVRAEQLVAVAGHSLGEYTALVAAGALSASQGAVLVQARGEAMQSAAESKPGTMAAVLGLELEGVTEACGDVEGAWVANDNSPGQVVIAGTLKGVGDASTAALKRGAKRVVPLQVGGAFHTLLMRPAQAPSTRHSQLPSSHPRPALSWPTWTPRLIPMASAPFFRRNFARKSAGGPRCSRSLAWGQNCSSSSARHRAFRHGPPYRPRRRPPQRSRPGRPRGPGLRHQFLTPAISS